MKGVLLLSGGIDSPVAGKIMMERGMELIGVHFHTQPFTDETSVKKSRELAEELGLEKLYIIPLGEQSSTMVEECNHRYYYILTRRLMWRVAERIAEEENADFLVTGENLGQVSSQTLENLTAVDRAVDIEVLRPLLGNDKNHTVEMAKEFGTYELSKGPEMCNALGPDNPITRAKMDKVFQEEEKIDIDGLMRKALEESQAEDVKKRVEA